MSARSLFLVFAAVGSAALGSSLAISSHFQAQGLQAGLPPVTQAIPSSPVVPSPPPVQTVQPAPIQMPVQTVPVVPIARTSSAEELAQARLQLRRAIREHNTALLKSLLRAGSVQEVLKTVVADQQAVVDPINLDNLDASAWAILERVMAHCNPADTTGSAPVELNTSTPQPNSRSQHCF